MLRKSTEIFLWVTAFGIAMGFMESAVVVYLREIYYPEGFTFPLKAIDQPIGTTEFIREAATIIMLLSIGFIAGRKPPEKFAYFIYTFAVWDIFYYVFLKVLLGWPESLLTWDILFLIPLTWVGPVLAPILNSVTTILLASVILYFSSRREKFTMTFTHWALLIIGAIITMINYMEDYTSYMLERFSFVELFSSSNMQEIMELNSVYIPTNFNWWLYAVGQLLFLAAVVLIIRKNRNAAA